MEMDQSVERVDNRTERVEAISRGISLVLVVIGLIVSGYLSYEQFSSNPVACLEDAGFQCSVVESSSYSKVLGIPVAYLGLATYVVIGLLTLLQNRVEFLVENGILLTFGIVLFAFLYSLYLVYVQGVILEAWCQWCLIHEAVMTLLFVVTSFRLWRYLRDEQLI